MAISGSYADDTPSEYSSIVDEVTKDQDDKTKKFETQNMKDAEENARKAAKEMEELMKGATEAVKEAKKEESVIEEKPAAAVIIDSEGNKPITGPTEIK
jgi:2,3-bisphosphoglycerate-independent phosphoglycerate mutase